MSEPYTVAVGHDGKFYLDGPAPRGECDFYGGSLYPWTRFETKPEADYAARFANMAYKEGYKTAQRDIKKALGIL